MRTRAAGSLPAAAALARDRPAPFPESSRRNVVSSCNRNVSQPVHTCAPCWTQAHFKGGDQVVELGRGEAVDRPQHRVLRRVQRRPHRRRRCLRCRPHKPCTGRACEAASVAARACRPAVRRALPARAHRGRPARQASGRAAAAGLRGPGRRRARRRARPAATGHRHRSRGGCARQTWPPRGPRTRRCPCPAAAGCGRTAGCKARSRQVVKSGENMAAAVRDRRVHEGPYRKLSTRPACSKISVSCSSLKLKGMLLTASDRRVQARARRNRVSRGRLPWTTAAAFPLVTFVTSI